MGSVDRGRARGQGMDQRMAPMQSCMATPLATAPLNPYLTGWPRLRVGPETLTMAIGRPLEPIGHARIIRDPRNARLDQFIPLDLAKHLFDLGALASVDIGEAYPNSYQRTGR